VTRFVELERDTQIQMAAKAITSPTAPPQTKRKMRQYARRVVDMIRGHEETQARRDGATTIGGTR
jgi:hypothetical protein